MAHFLDVAHKILMEEHRALSARELTDIGLQRGYLQTTGLTPAQTMKSKLSTDILTSKDESAFMRTEEGKFALREWKHERYGEYVADRFAKGLLLEDAVVFPASSLSRYIPGPGMHAMALADGQSLLAECGPMLREDAESDFSVIQLVSVFVLRYENRYLTYKRTKRLPESRLHGCYSMVFGGHINPDETLPLFNIFDPHNGEWLLRRELEEEVRFDRESFPEICYKGLLYDNSREVSKQHLGIVYDVFLRSAEFAIGERGFLMDAKFESLDEIDARSTEFENWSLLVAGYEREHATPAREVGW
jgi:predicted NUDIX family phosphoesterase